MPDTGKNIKSILQRINNHPFIVSIDSKTIILIALGITAYVIITVDLGSELAVEKDEIGYTLATLTNSLTNVNFVTHGFLIINPPFLGVVPPIIYSFLCNDIINFPKDRSPPSV